MSGAPYAHHDQHGKAYREHLDHAEPCACGKRPYQPAGLAERCEQAAEYQRAEYRAGSKAEQQANCKAHRIFDQQDNSDVPPPQPKNGVQRQLAAAVFEQIAIDIHEKRHEHDRHQEIADAHQQQDVAAVRDALRERLVIDE